MIEIPLAIESVLAKDRTLDGAVKLSLSAFVPWLASSGLPFFPEYTDHGPNHISNVLKTASSLISDEGKSTFTPADAATLTLAVLLHDSAMHLSEDGFVALIGSASTNTIITGFEDRPWSLLWEEFMAEASRFDGRKLKALFDDTQPVHRPALNPQDMTRRDRLLIGEFLRRHHPRLAHEIALTGVPSLEDNPLRLKEVPAFIADLAGLVARSHGLPVRSALPYLQRKYDIREYQKVHTVFLMSLLRVADYLQVEAERAPSQVLQVRQLRSPLSRREWNAHHAIRDIRNTHEDPEAIYIDAMPLDVSTYLKIKEWLAGIQAELDSSWAVLGEVYGRYKGLSSLLLTLRRVRSNLDDEGAFAQQVKYVPCRAMFEAANADLLQLLIGPLYDNEPKVGVRELIQNAVDAVRELQEYRQNLSTSIKIIQPSQKADVIVSIDVDERGGYWLTVSDCGIGMTLETVRNYFLKAGASFRRSDEWRKRFEDPEGKSRVLRSGRFGVGALAAYLMGDEIKVSTRHVESPVNEGIEFRTTLDNDSIELLRCERSVGTTVQVRLSKDTMEWFSASKNDKSWDWYCLSEPTVLRLGYDGTELCQQFSLPSPDADLPVTWRRIHHPDFSDIQWTYDETPTLVCNGIVVKSDPYRWREFYLNRPIEFSRPSLSVFDPDGNLSLNLQRTAVSKGGYQFSDLLLQDVFKDFFAFILAHIPANATIENKNQLYTELRYPGSFGSELFPYLVTSEGICPADAWFVRELGIESLLITTWQRGSDSSTNIELQSGQALLIHQTKDHLLKKYDFVTKVIESLKTIPHRYTLGIQDISVASGRILVDRVVVERMASANRPRKELRETIVREWENPNWILFRNEECPDTSYDFATFAKKNSVKGVSLDILAEFYLDPNHEVPTLSPLAIAWREIIGEVLVPFDNDERIRKLSNAYKTLKPYIDSHNLQVYDDRSSAIENITSSDRSLTLAHEEE